MNYSDEVQAHDRRIRGLFALYNDRRFDAMLEHYCEDVICFLPTVIDENHGDMQWSHGRAQYRRNLERFRDIFGAFAVHGVFATADGSSVLVTDARGNTGTFSFEVTPERKVSRVFFHHQPGRASHIQTGLPGLANAASGAI